MSPVLALSGSILPTNPKDSVNIFMRIAITGSSGYVGTLLLNRLSVNPRVEKILALDHKDPSSKPHEKVTSIKHDISEPMPSIFENNQIDTVVHLAYMLKPKLWGHLNRRVNVKGTENLIDACKNSSVKRIVYLSSTSVYGALETNSSPLTENVPPKPLNGFQYSEHKIMSEELIKNYSEITPGVDYCILRCCPIMGPYVNNFISRAFLKPFLVKVSGANPELQFIHEIDAINCLESVSINHFTGTFNIAGKKSISWENMVKKLNIPTISIPAWLLYPITQISWLIRIQRESPAIGLNFIRYPWLADTSKAINQGLFDPVYTASEAWDSYVSKINT